MAARLTIIIVNWNSGNLLAACLESIVQHHCGVVQAIVVVDNHSTDDSLEMVNGMDTAGIRLEMIRNETNRGFAVACNQGARLAESEYLLFLNPDAMLYDDSLVVPLEFMEQKENKGVGAVGIQLIDETGCVARSCARFPSVGRFFADATGLAKFPGLRSMGMTMTDWPHTRTRAVDQVIGAFLLIRSSLFARLEGFDERFFVYWEDVDISRRLRNLGYESVYLASAQAFHKGGGTSARVKSQRLYYSMRSRIQYGFKHFGSMDRWALVVITLMIEPIARCLHAGARGDVAGLRNTLKGYGMLYRNFLQAWRRRAH